MRSNWQLTAKWLSALAATFLIVAASVSYTLYRITQHDTATGAFTAIAVSLLEDRVDAEEFEQLKAQVAANPDAEYTVPGVNVTVTGRELAALTLPEALDLVVGRTADTLYYEGTDAAEPLFSEEAGPAPVPPPGAQPSEEGGPAEEEHSLDTGAFSIFSQDSHDFFKPLIYAFSLMALVPMALLVLFSRRFGRLGSPGVALLLGTAPFALLWTTASRVADKMAEEPDDLGGRLAETLTPTIDDLSRVFLRLAILGGVAVAAAVAGHVAFAIRSRLRPENAQEESPAADASLADLTEKPPAPRFEDEWPSPPDELPSIGPGGLPQP